MAFSFQKRRPDEQELTIPQAGRTDQDAKMVQPSGMGIPGVQAPQGIDPRMAAMLLSRKSGAQAITKEDIAKAATILKQYKDGKANLEERVVKDELWWQLRHWEAIRGGKAQGARPGEMPEPSSAWLFNCILNKHADAMDNYPEPVVLPREQSDQDSAKNLSSVLPVILE